MPAPGSSQLGERVAAFEARFEGFERYTHDRWHDLANTLQPLQRLPEQIARDVAKMQGTIDGRMDTLRRDMERTIGEAITAALAPVVDDVLALKSKVDELERQQSHLKGARMLAVWIIQTLIAAIVAIVALTARGK